MRSREEIVELLASKVGRMSEMELLHLVGVQQVVLLLDIRELLQNQELGKALGKRVDEGIREDYPKSN